MKRFFLHVVVLVSTTFFDFQVNGQYYFYNEDYYESALIWEMGFSLGGMNCLTDLGGKKGVGRKFIKDVNWNTTSPCGSVFLGANYKDIVGARLELAFGQVKASDNLLKNDKSEAYGRYLRNLNFRSEIKEISFSFECYPFAIFDRSDFDPPVLNPYISIAAGCFNFSPETFYNNSWINVADLHTEGQGFQEYPDRKAYKLTQFNMPIGLGFKYEASPVLNFHFEIIYRKLWTDYLDDVSKNYIDPALFQRYFTSYKANLAAQLADRRLPGNIGITKSADGVRGNANNNDAYFSGVIKIAFIMGRQRR